MSKRERASGGGRHHYHHPSAPLSPPPTSSLKLELKTTPLLVFVIVLLILPLYYTALELTSQLDSSHASSSSLYPDAATTPPPAPAPPPRIEQQEEVVVLGEEEEEKEEAKPRTRRRPATPSPTTSSSSPIPPAKDADTEDADEEEDFVAPLIGDPVEANGCEFGWHSPSLVNTRCFHVALAPMFMEEASLHCRKLSPLADLATLPTVEDVAFACRALDRTNNRLGQPNELHVGLVRNPFGGGGTGGESFFKWREGPTAAVSSSSSVALPTERAYDALLVTLGALPAITLQCNTEETSPVVAVRADAALVFVCSSPKSEHHVVTPAAAAADASDSVWNEESDMETAKWTDIADFASGSGCPRISQHLNPSLSALPEQISWKLSDYTPRSESKRYYLVWQSKSWFGWLDFWVDYLVRYRDFHGAPVGKFVTQSRAASEHLGWSNIFANPLVAQKYGASLVVLSRLPVPENVLMYLPKGTLVNQVYYDPYARVPLGDKLELSAALTHYQKQLGSGGEKCDLQVTPLTFDVSQVKQCRELRDLVSSSASASAASSNWIIKGPHHGGAAITIATAPQVLKRLGDCSPASMSKLRLQHEIVQRLVDTPLLLDGRKFDLRVFVLIASTQPLLVYIHREPYFRAAMRKYSGLEKNRHVTNTHIQKLRSGGGGAGASGNFTDKDWADHIWTLDRVKSLAGKAGLDPEFYMRDVFPKIKRSVQVVLKASAHSLTRRRPGQWKLFGVDFVIDSELRPLLLDWNSFPGWDWSYRMPWTLEYRRRILGDAWRLTLDVQRGKAVADSRATPKSAGFELVYHTKG